jgi:MFS family permease
VSGSTFESLKIPAFRRLWIGGLFYFLSIFAQMVARGLLAHELKGSNTALGAVTLAFGLTGLISTPLGGVAADRFPKRLMLLGSTGLLLASSLWIAIAVEFGFIEFWMLLAASALQSAGFSGLSPARMAFTAELVGPANLTNGVVLSQISMNSNRVVGPLLAGAILGVPALGIAGVYWTCTGLTLVSGLLFMTLPPGNPQNSGPRRTPIQDMAAGLRYASSHWPMPLLLITSTLVIMLGFPYIAFLPTVAAELFSDESLGFSLLSAVGAVGGLAASLFIAGRAEGDIAWRIQTVSAVGFGVGVVALAVSPTALAALLVTLPLGAASAAFQSMNGTLVLSCSDSSYHGRMQSLLQLGFNLFGIGALPMGMLADWWGLDKTLTAMGLSTAVVGAASGLIRRRTGVGVP